MLNKVMLLGRLTADPDVRYSQGERPIARARFSLAVNRRFKKDGERGVDFIDCVAFGKGGEFVERYFKKGQRVNIVGRLQVGNWKDDEGKSHKSVEVIVEEQYFAESKSKGASDGAEYDISGFVPIDEDDDGMPF